MVSKKQKVISLQPNHFLKKTKAPKHQYNIQTLNYELERLYHDCLPHNTELQSRNKVFGHVKKYLQRHMPGYDIILSGSTMYDCFLHKSNVNICIIKKDDIAQKLEKLRITKKQNKNNDITILNEILAKSKYQKDLVVYKSKFYEKIKLLDTKTNLKLEFTFNIECLKRAEYINKCMNGDKNIKPIYLLLKLFFDVRQFTSVTQINFTSYHLFLLVNHFLCLHPLYKRMDAVNNLGVILMDFFQYFGVCFDFDCVTINKDFYSKKTNAYKLSIIDPITQKDIGNVCCDMKTIKEMFRHNFKIMELNLKDARIYKKSFSKLWFNYNYFTDRNKKTYK